MKIIVTKDIGWFSKYRKIECILRMPDIEIHRFSIGIYEVDFILKRKQ